MAHAVRIGPCTSPYSWANTSDCRNAVRNQPPKEDAPWQWPCVSTSRRFYEALKRECPDKDWDDFYSRNSKKFKSDDDSKKEAREAKAEVEAAVEAAVEED